MHDPVFLCFFFHQGALEHLEETKLELIRFHPVHIIKRTVESIIILIRKSCDQIQVLVDVSKAVHLRNTSLQFVKIHMSVDRMNGVRICGLYTDLKLDKSGTHPAHKLHFFVPEKVCRNFKMKIRDPIVMLQDIFPDRHCVLVLTVKRTVHKLDLRHPVIQEKL